MWLSKVVCSTKSPNLLSICVFFLIWSLYILNFLLLYVFIFYTPLSLSFNFYFILFFNLHWCGFYFYFSFILWFFITPLSKIKQQTQVSKLRSCVEIENEIEKETIKKAKQNKTKRQVRERNFRKKVVDIIKGYI